MSEFSPAAQAMLDAYSHFVAKWLAAAKTEKPSAHYHASGIAAVLRALADEVVPAEPYYENCDVVREEILDIAIELEGAGL
jgi:hypothetical protein